MGINLIQYTVHFLESPLHANEHQLRLMIASACRSNLIGSLDVYVYLVVGALFELGSAELPFPREKKC